MGQIYHGAASLGPLQQAGFGELQAGTFDVERHDVHDPKRCNEGRQRPLRLRASCGEHDQAGKDDWLHCGLWSNVGKGGQRFQGFPAVP